MTAHLTTRGKHTRRLAGALAALSGLFAKGRPAPHATASTGYEFAGWASWYGAELAGRPTASGEPFDPDGHTAAHRWLPFGTWLEVRRSDRPDLVTWVRVNDRGPWLAGRVLDLSRAAMQRLDGIAAGLIHVHAAVASPATGYPGPEDEQQ